MTCGREGEQQAMFNAPTIALSSPNEMMEGEHPGERENVPHENTSSRKSLMGNSNIVNRRTVGTMSPLCRVN